MPLHIVDGSGKGYRAFVDKEGHLDTHSIIDDISYYHTRNKAQCYSANTTNTADTLTATTTGGAILYLRNDSDTYELTISKLMFSAGIAGLVAKVIKNPTLGTIGKQNTHTPVNLNFNSNNPANVTCYNWDETGDGMTGLTVGTTMATFILPASPLIIPVDGAILLKRNDSIQINCKGAGEFTAFIRFFMREIV